jgi:hypothetical protein
MQAHGDVVRGRFAPRPTQVEIFAHDELKNACQRGFERRDIHLSVTLRGMSVAHFEQRAARLDRDVERRAGDQFLVVQVASVEPRRSAADAARSLRRRDAHTPKERPQRNLDPIGKVRYHAVPVEWDDFDSRVRKFIRQKTGARPKAVVRIRNGEPDRLDTHFECVARLGAFDVNRPGENVSARSLIGDFFVNRPQRRFDLVRRDAGRFQARGTVGD